MKKAKKSRGRKYGTSGQTLKQIHRLVGPKLFAKMIKPAPFHKKD